MLSLPLLVVKLFGLAGAVEEATNIKRLHLISRAYIHIHTVDDSVELLPCAMTYWVFRSIVVGVDVAGF